MLRPLAVLAMILALALAACGGDDGVSPGPTLSAATTATPAASPRPSPAPGEIVEQLAYVGADGEIRLVNADGSGNHVLSGTPCDAGSDVQGFEMAWALDGRALGYICVSGTTAGRTLLVIKSDGEQISSVQEVSHFRWSPDSSRLAYQSSTEHEAFVVGFLDAETGVATELRHGAALLEWVGPGSLLLGLEPVFGDLALAFKAHLVNVVSGESTALPEFDDAAALWVSPNGAKMVLYTHPSGSAPGMAVYDFATTLTTVIEGGHIGYPSEFIPRWQLAFSPDSATVYWANAGDAPPSIWEARLDAPEATRLGEIDSPFPVAVVSPLGRVSGLTRIPNSVWISTVVIQDLSAATPVEIGRGLGPFAWRTVVH